ncbi:MAG: hypothetical protein JWO87_3976 [Phycisphaerales bacterium]|jgi:hypothetical protein|nr:hypothetical protein [Phycisphaerales bacterium]
MHTNSRHVSSAPACFEALESRRLMSVAPASAAMADWAAKAATKVHLTVPLVNGDVFTGVATSKDGSPASLTLTITAEGKTGKLTGILVIDDGAGSSGPKTFAFTGSVNKHNVFTIKATGPDKQTAVLTGTFSADTKTVSGKFVAHKPKHPADSGTFVASRP